MFDRVLNTPPNIIIENFTLEFSGRHNHSSKEVNLLQNKNFHIFVISVK